MLWYKVFHFLGLIVWIGGLLDLTRILGYHVKEDEVVQKRLSWMEHRMFFFVSTPGLIIALVFGLLLFMAGGGPLQYFKGSGWFHAKSTLILILFFIHFFVGKKILAFKEDHSQKNPAVFKALHGVAALCVTLSIILAVVKPF